MNERFRGFPPGSNGGTQLTVYRLLARPTPFAFPLMVEWLREQVTMEMLLARIERMLAGLEAAALYGVPDIVSKAGSLPNLVHLS